MYVYERERERTHATVDHEAQKSSESPDLELQTVVPNPTGVLGNEPQISCKSST